ncbi:hypothetical protein VNO77_04654 [Canavalia gladiata]|uniref:glucan endo-1,3-beta-D-glucosidase n=1 Tax=Canavalia gladiata TaxID=3824 RepID=A0AAN9RDE6_CANGL
MLSNVVRVDVKDKTTQPQVTMATFIRRMAIGYIFFTLFFSADIGSFGRVASFGINYGQVANNLPPPERVLELFSNFKITKTRIYDTNPQILNTFAKSNVEVIVTIENNLLSQLNDPQQALQWVSGHIKPYLPDTKITGIQVGNEVYTDADTTLIQFLVPAVVNIHNALVQLGIDSNIHVSSPSSLAVLQESYPPSAGSFKSEISGIMYQFMNFLSNTKAPFWINAYPYFAYKNDPNGIPLDYVLFNPNEGMVDPNTNLHYDNMLYAQVDAVAFAIAKLGFNGIEVRVSETGWPSKGDPDEFGATVQNAQTYNRNLLRRQMANEGTPLSPRMRLEAYLFALFNEDLKNGATSERNYGLFQPDESMAYNVGLSTFAATSTSSTSISLTSSATKTKAASKEFQSLFCWMFVYLLTSALCGFKSGPTHFLNDGATKSAIGRRGKAIQLEDDPLREWLHFHPITPPLATFKQQACGYDVRLSTKFNKNMIYGENVIKVHKVKASFIILKRTIGRSCFIPWPNNRQHRVIADPFPKLFDINERGSAHEPLNFSNCPTLKEN